MKKIFLIILSLTAMAGAGLTQDIPNLIFPPADTTTNDSFPNFDWSDVATASQYQLQIGKGHLWALVTYFYDGLYSFNVSNPNEQPQFCGSAYGGNASDVAIKDSFALVASNQSIYIINISDPSVPQYRGGVSVGSSNLTGIIIRDTLAYVSDWGSGLIIVNVKNPLAMTIVGSYDTPGNPRGLALSGNYVYLADGSSGLQVIDVSDPANPVLTGGLDTPGDAQAVTVSGNYAYVADYTGGMRVINISNPASPVEAGSFTSGTNYSKGVTVKGTLAYLADGSYGMRIINISNPASPIEFGYHDSSGMDNDYRRVVLDDTLAYVVDYSYGGLWIINVNDPYHPKTVSHYGSNYFTSLTLLDSFAAISTDTVVAVSACEPDSFPGDGARYWRVRAEAGTWGEYSQPRRFIMDTQAPGQCWINSPSYNALINDNTPQIWVYKQYNEYRFQLQIATDTSFTAIVQDTISFSEYIELLTPLPDGWLYCRARGADLAGNWSTWSNRLPFRLDSQAPGQLTAVTANGASPSLWTKNNLFSVNFTVPPDSSVINGYFYKMGSAPSSNYDTTGYGVSFSKPFSISVDNDGITPFYVWARDQAGNLDYNNAGSVNLRYDHIAPQGAIAQSNEYSRTNNFNLAWTAGSDQGGSGLNGNYWIKYKVNSGSWTDLDVNYSGTTYIFTGSNGNKYYFEVSAWDSAGNSEAFAGAAECSTLVDNTINFPVLVSPYNGVSIDTNQTDFMWQKVPGYSGSRLQCSYNSAFTALSGDTVLATDSMCTLTLSDSLYYWRVQGRNSSTDTSSWSPYRTFRVDTQAPEAPYLVDPANDTLINDNTPLFVWKEVTGAKQYRLELSAADSNFTVKLKDVFVDTAEYIIDITLPDSIYYWRVGAGDSAGNWSPSSEKWHFTIDTKAPAVPSPVSPNDNANLTTNIPQFIWQTSAQAVQYSFQASKSTGFETLEYDTLITDTLYTPVWGLNDGTHYWRVRCRDAAGNWSAYSSYRTLNIAGILQVVQVIPSAGRMWPASQSVWIQFTKPIYTGYIDTTHIKIRGKRSAIVRQTFTWQAASRTLMVSPDSSFAANDTVTVFLHGTLRDSSNVSTLDGNYSGTATGDSSDSYQMSFYTTKIGDYDTNRVINSVDLALFSWAWIQPTYYRMFETGPLVGTWPHQKIYIGSSSSNRIDFEDLAGFIYSWNMADNAKAETAINAKNGPVKLVATRENDEIKITARIDPEFSFACMDAELEYDQSAIKITSMESSEMWQESGYPKLFLSKQNSGKITVSAAKWKTDINKTADLFSAGFSENKKGTTAAFTLNYTLYGQDGRELHAGSTTASSDLISAVSAGFYLGRAIPNPANRPISISCQIPRRSQVKLEIYNVAGQHITTLIDGIKEAGYYNLTWDLKDRSRGRVPNGIYIYKLTADEFRGIGKIVIIK